MRLYKRSEAGLVIILVLVIVVISFGWIINISQRECRTNSDCSSQSYCGSDFSCHQFPTIEKTVVQNNFLFPSIVIGIALIIAAIIFRFGNLQFNGKSEEEMNLAVEQKDADILSNGEQEEDYYKPNNDIRTP